MPLRAMAHGVDIQGGAPSEALGWSLDPWVVGTLALVLVLQTAGHLRLRARSGAASRRHRDGQALAFLGGWLALVVALVSPLDALGSAVFSAHMVQHEILMLIAAPLLVLARPLAVWIWAFPAGARRRIGQAVRQRAVDAAWRRITTPIAAWLLHAVVLWAWHAPWLFEAALARPWIHALQHTSFLASALLFWWTLLGPRGRQASDAMALLSLFTTMAHTGALGALLTLAPTVWYPSYVGPSTALGFEPLEDQWLGGLVMWVPGGLAYLVAALAMAGRWFAERVATPHRVDAAASPRRADGAASP